MTARIVKTSALVSVLLTILFTVLYKASSSSIVLSMAITFGTVSYHFLMRLVVGYIIDRIFHNGFDPNRKIFLERRFEKHLYKVLKVKKWKDKMPTFTPHTMDLKEHSLEEVAGAMCQAEIVHSIIAVLCFVPLLAVFTFGALQVFLTTSILSACLEIMFIILQRYNRPRIKKLIEKQKKSVNRK